MPDNGFVYNFILFYICMDEKDEKKVFVNLLIRVNYKKRKRKKNQKKNRNLIKLESDKKSQLFIVFKVGVLRFRKYNYHCLYCHNASFMIWNTFFGNIIYLQFRYNQTIYKLHFVTAITYFIHFNWSTCYLYSNINALEEPLTNAKQITFIVL